MDNTQNTPETDPPVSMMVVVFNKDGIDVKLMNMSAIPLATVERAQHLMFRAIMIDRQQAAYRRQGKREAGWDNSQERKVTNVA